MADTKITDLTALTGANLATGDDFAVVDVSDTSMAGSGTDKKITANELRIAMATTFGIAAIDKIYDAAGDIAIGTGADTSVALTAGTAGGAALTADPNATNKVSYQYPHGVEASSRGSASSLASSYDRRWFVTQNSAAKTSATLYLQAIQLPKGMSCTTITFWSGTTALGAGSNQWFALFNNSRGKLAVTADDTNTAWAANSAKTLTIASGPFVTTYAGWYYTGYLVKAGTMPSSWGVGSLDALARSVAPICSGSADAALTDPASCPSTAASLTALGTMMYCEIA